MIDYKGMLNQFKGSPCKIGDLILDVVVTEAPDFTWTTTQYKMQSGFTATDARIKDPVKLVLDCVFVDETFGLGDLITSAMTQTAPSMSTWRDKYAALKELADSEDVVTVTIGLDVFPNMTIKNLGIVRDEKRAGYLSFTLSLEEIRIVEIDFDDVDTSLMPKDEEIAPKEKSKKNPKPSPDKKNDTKPASEPERGSTLYGMVY